MRVYHVKVQKVGRKWIELLVTGKSTDFKAKAEKEKMPDNLAVGDEIDLPGYIEANDSGYGRKQGRQSRWSSTTHRKSVSCLGIGSSNFYVSSQVGIVS